MKIVLFHPVRFPVSRYGGVERVVEWLASALVERGQDVYLGALTGSTPPQGVTLIEVSPSAREFPRLLLPPGVDVVHCMAPPESEHPSGVHTVVTIHGNGNPGERFHPNAVFLSADHARRHGRTAFVHNGIPVEEYVFAPKTKGDRFLFLSKTHLKTKNVRGAIALCNRVRAPLTVAGGMRPLRLSVPSRLGFGRARWAGSVNEETKRKLLAEARALLFPILWDEPFGLAVVEALASGTPVLAAPRGSMPELVSPEVGALCHTDADWEQAMTEGWRRFDPAACRAWAESRFSHRRMAAEYESFYRGGRQ